MIISASRRTDIPALYSEWFMHRLREGYVSVTNPFNAAQVKRVSLARADVDCFVFWTKNPSPMLPFLDEIREKGYPFFFQFTLTPYGRDVERNLPDKDALLQTFAALAAKAQVVWRYDPILLTDELTVDWHLRQFAAFCERLRPHTERCVLSFLDMYRGMDKRFHAVTDNEMHALACGLAGIAKRHDLPLYACAEEIDFTSYGILPSACIDRSLVEAAAGRPIAVKPDKNQRPACNCLASADIGAYGTCTNGCAYCYATKSEKTALRRFQTHNPLSPSL